MTYDVIWYWQGGRVDGRWRSSWPAASNLNGPTSENVEHHIKYLNSTGYVAHRGTRKIGPPDGPPDDSEFKAIGL